VEWREHSLTLLGRSPEVQRCRKMCAGVLILVLVLLPHGFTFGMCCKSLPQQPSFQVLADVHVTEVARGLGAAVQGIVLRCRDDAVIMRIIALHAGDEGDGHACAQEWIFSVSFLATTPTRVAKDVDVRRPEIKTFKNVGVPGAFVLRVFDSSLNADRGRHLVDAGNIEGGGETNGSGNSVTPSEMTPCKASLHQSYEGIFRRGMARA